MLRSHEPERLDAAHVDPTALAQSLDDVRAANRWLGGYRGLRRHLEDLRNVEGPLRLLDVGAGDASTLAHLAEWAPMDWKFVGVELHPQVAGIASDRLNTDRRLEGNRRIRLVRGDGLHLPLRDRSFDVVFCTLTLHHFDDHDAVRLMREMARVARRRLLVNDLERRPLNYVGALCLACTVWLLHPITRHDGPLSVRRSFTAPELVEIADAAGVPGARVRRHFPFRLVLQADVE